MRHIDLFSGIGGFAYAAKEVWGEECRTVLFCDNDKFCQASLRKNFPGVLIWGDIRDLIRHAKGNAIGQVGEVQGGESPIPGRGDSGIGESGITSNATIGSGRESPESRERRPHTFGLGNITSRGIFLLTGGFPCQPFSTAGKRRGKRDDRFLWPEMLECIRLFRPAWVIAENVYGILNIEGGLVFEQVCSGLESAGYEVWPFIVPACAVNAPHRRDRIWIVAHSIGDSPDREEKRVELPEAAGTQEQDRTQHSPAGELIRAGSGERGERLEEDRTVAGDASDSEQPRAGDKKSEACDQGRESPRDRTPCIRQGNRETVPGGIEPADRDASNAERQGWKPPRDAIPGKQGLPKREPKRGQAARPDKDVTDPRLGDGERPRDAETFEAIDRENKRTFTRNEIGGKFERGSWQADWRQVAAATCVRGVDDGIPRFMDGVCVSEARQRTERLKMLGNSIVPQVAVEIMRMIKEMSENNDNRTQKGQLA